MDLFGPRSVTSLYLITPDSKGKSNDSANCEKHIEDVLERYETDDILTSFSTLQQYCKSQRQGTDAYNEFVYLQEELTTKMYRILSKVNTKMSKFYNGTTPWSPQIQTH